MDHLKVIREGPLPPADALPDRDAPGIYHLFAAELIITFGLYDDVMYLWSIQVNS